VLKVGAMAHLCFALTIVLLSDAARKAELTSSQSSLCNYLLVLVFV
jgi:hypothetical protein